MRACPAKLLLTITPNYCVKKRKEGGLVAQAGGAKEMVSGSSHSHQQGGSVLGTSTPLGTPELPGGAQNAALL